MTAGANGPRLDALLRQMSHSGGPPSKKPKVGKRLLKKTIRTFKNFPTLRRRDYSSSFSKVQMCAKSNPLKDKSAQWCRAKNPKFSSAAVFFILSSFLSTPHFFCWKAYDLCSLESSIGLLAAFDKRPVILPRFLILSWDGDQVCKSEQGVVDSSLGKKK